VFSATPITRINVEKSPHMKTRFASSRFALMTVGAQQTAVTTTTAASSDGSSSTSTQTTTTAGTIQEFTPGSSQLIVRTTSGSPVTYSYSKRTTFVDAAGNTVSYETIKPGEPTTVYYTMEAGQPVVSKVVVHRTVSAPATATTTEVQPAAVVAPAAPVIQAEKTETTTTTTGGK
jgi:hypothetical protein